ncbi:hypothetical protein PA18A_3291 [Pseudomonas aeruginosa 18A]|nr:hypothetical protein PA18A_3291 [Pseudomonas aeruginosa 18A]
MARLHALLGAADEVVAVEGDAAAGGGVADDVGTQEDHQVGLGPRALLVAEQRADAGEAGESGNAVGVVLHVVLQQAAEDHDLAVVEEDAGIDRALVGDHPGGGAGALVDAADLLVDVELDRSSLGDLRTDVQLQADVLALDGLERVVAGTAAVGDVLAADEGYGLADHDARRLVVQGQQVRGRQDVGAAAALQRPGEHLEVEDLADPGDVHGAIHQADVEPLGQHVDGVLAGRVQRRLAEVDPAEHAVAAEVAGLPLDAELAGVVFADLDDQAFDHHLGAALVEQVDDFAEVAVQRLGCGNQQGVGGGVGLYGDPAGGERRVLLAHRTGSGAALAAAHRTIGAAAAVAAAQPAGTAARGIAAAPQALATSTAIAATEHAAAAQARALLVALVALAAAVAGDQPAQGLGQAGRLGVAQVDHMEVAGIALHAVQLADQVARQLRALWARRADHDAVGAWVGEHHGLLALLGAAAALAVEQFGDGAGDVHRDAVLDRYHVGVAGAGDVDAGDDPGDPVEVFRVVGDHHGVVPRIGIDRVVLRDDRAQYRDQVHRVLVAQAEGPRDHAVGRRPVGAVDRPAEQLGVGLRHHLADPVDVDHAEALHAQGAGEHAVGGARRHLAFGNQGQLALHPRVDQELPAGGARQRAHHRFHLGIDEIQADRLLAEFGRCR